jgi:hypothetical protein
MIGVSAPAMADDLTGYASVGMRAGLAQFTGGLNFDRLKPNSQSYYGKSTAPRPAGDLVFGYVWSDHINLDLWSSWAWSRLKSDSPGAEDSFYVATVVPVLLGARYLARDGHPWRPYVGAGGGIYWWSVLNRDLSAAKDPGSFARLRKGVPGVYGTLGVQHRFSKYITGTGDVVYHYLFAEDLKDFPSGFNENKSYVQVRLGVNFYFSVSERIETGFPE